MPAPPAGPTTGDTLVAVTGDNYLYTGEATCKFGGLEVNASYDAVSGGLQCYSPVCCYNDESQVKAGPHGPSAPKKTHRRPPSFDPPLFPLRRRQVNERTTINFEAALNGQQYTSSGIGAVAFRFYDPPTVSSISPVIRVLATTLAYSCSSALWEGSLLQL